MIFYLEKLQWGRSVNAAETLSCPRRAGERVCFNGAAALTLRKRCDQGSRAQARCGFNGAAALTLRKPRRPASSRSASTCFNGAAALTLRKPAPLRDRYQSALASMGPQR